MQIWQRSFHPTYRDIRIHAQTQPTRQVTTTHVNLRTHNNNRRRNPTHPPTHAPNHTLPFTTYKLVTLANMHLVLVMDVGPRSDQQLEAAVVALLTCKHGRGLAIILQRHTDAYKHTTNPPS